MLIRRLMYLVALWACSISLYAESPPTAALEAKETVVQVETHYRYWQHLPEGYASSTEKFPLLLFLHGGGESGSDLELVKKHGVPKEILNGRKLPCIVLAPQNPHKEQQWDDQALYRFLEQQVKALRVDESRIYLAGMSRGGHGVYRMAIQNPGRFAAVVMVCGGGTIAYAKRVKQIPFWFFHGDSDVEVPTEESRRLSAALQALGAEAKLTIYPNTQHDSWTKAFAEDGLYEWLLSKRLKP
jgi:predicted peptidase